MRRPEKSRPKLFGKFMTDGMEKTATVLLAVLYSKTMVGSIGGGRLPTDFIDRAAHPRRPHEVLTYSPMTPRAIMIFVKIALYTHVFTPGYIVL